MTNSELERMLKEIVVTLFKILSCIYLEGLRITARFFSRINRSPGVDWKQRQSRSDISHSRVRLCKDIQPI